ncbi:hypothetical protein F4780DRAFT_741060 [Xylariomycetidae sp. FL0641]|nr:hypothetical protein F4780DRAFT_741060 [Xylariomycetidae sp. FL0641]
MKAESKTLGRGDEGNTRQMPWVVAPDPEQHLVALVELEAMAYIDEPSLLPSIPGGQITLKGLQAAKFPGPCKWFNTILVAHDLGCGREMCAIAACLSERTSVFLPSVDMYEAQLWIPSPWSDHILLLRAFCAYLRLKNDMAARSTDNLLNFGYLEQVEETYKGYCSFFQNQGCLDGPLSHQGANPDPFDVHERIRKALARGLFLTTAIRDPKGSRGRDCYRTINQHCSALAAIDCALAGNPPKWVVYDEFLKSSGMQYLHVCSKIYPEWIEDLKYFQHGNLATGIKSKSNELRQPFVHESLERSRALKNERPVLQPTGVIDTMAPADCLDFSSETSDVVFEHAAPCPLVDNMNGWLVVEHTGTGEIKYLPEAHIWVAQTEGWDLWRPKDKPTTAAGVDKRSCQHARDTMRLAGRLPWEEMATCMEAAIELAHSEDGSTHWEPGMQTVGYEKVPDASPSVAPSFDRPSVLTEHHSATSIGHAHIQQRPSRVGAGWGDYDDFHAWQSAGRVVTADMLPGRVWSTDVLSDTQTLIRDGHSHSSPAQLVMGPIEVPDDQKTLRRSNFDPPQPLKKVLKKQPDKKKTDEETGNKGRQQARSWKRGSRRQARGGR